MQKHYKPSKIQEVYILKVMTRPLFTFCYYFSNETKLNNVHSYYVKGR